MAITSGARWWSACAVVVVTAAVIAAGCGGGKSSSKSTTSESSSGTTSAGQWANSLCSSLTTWSTSVHSAATSLQSNVSKSSLKSASDDVKSATDKLESDLKGLGKPDVQAGTKVKESVNSLSDQLKTGADTINKAVHDASTGGGVLQAVSTVSSTLVTLGDHVTAAFASVQQLDAKGDLEKAFKNADSCKALIKQGS